jgi:hypothetical protein
VSLGIAAIIDALDARAATLGVFDVVNMHEPKNAPGRGIICSFWGVTMRPVGAASGLNVASVSVEFQYRIQTNMLQEPQDSIDSLVIDAADQLFASLIGSFSLAGSVRDIDIFGEHSEGLRAVLGYLNQDSMLYRVADIFVPMTVDNVYPEVA